MKKIFHIIFTFCFIILFLISCSTHANIKSDVKTFKNCRIAVAETFFMHEIFGVTDPLERFNKNLFTGAIIFEGGFIRNPEMGMMVQSKNKTLTETELFEKNAKKFSSELIQTVLNERHIENSIISSPAIPKLIIFSDEIDRVQYPEDLRDSINLPRMIRTPVTVDKKTAGLLLNELKTRYLAVPLIEYYYGHSGGWFNGQNIGTGAGSRISLKLYIIDLEESAIVLSYEKTAVNIFEYTFTISIVEMGQDLYKNERKIINELKRVFPD